MVWAQTLEMGANFQPFMSHHNKQTQVGSNKSRSETDKATTMLETNPQLRPRIVQKVTSVPQAEKWRDIVLREISVRLTKIQDISKSDGEIRNINDELNKLFKEKRAWEHHIKYLGGPDYLNLPSMERSGELDIFSNIKGYRYYGRAKELLDVKQLLQAKRKNQGTLKPNDVMANLSDDYFTDLDYRPFRSGDKDEPLDNLSQQLLTYMTHQDSQANAITTDQRDLEFIDIEIIPSNEEISQWVIEQRKQQVMQRLNP